MCSPVMDILDDIIAMSTFTKIHTGFDDDCHRVVLSYHTLRRGQRKRGLTFSSFKETA